MRMQQERGVISVLCLHLMIYNYSIVETVNLELHIAITEEKAEINKTDLV